MTPEEQAAAEKAAQEAKDKAEKESKEKETPQSLETALAELARTRDALTAANHEAADRRKKLTAYEAAELKRQEDEKKRRDAELSDIDKLKNQIAERDTALKDLTEKQSQLLRRQAIEREAAQAKWGKGKRAFIKPDQAYLLADLTGVTQDGDKFVGLDAALEKLANENEHLLAQAKPTLPATNSTTVNSGTDADAKRKELLQRFPRLKI